MTTKKSLINLICNHSGEKRTVVEKIVQSFLVSVGDLLQEEDHLTLTGYFTFRKRFKPAHNGHDPRTGKTIKIADNNLLTCRFGSKLKEAINPGRKEKIAKTKNTKTKKQKTTK